MIFFAAETELLKAILAIQHEQYKINLANAETMKAIASKEVVQSEAGNQATVNELVRAPQNPISNLDLRGTVPGAT